MPVFELDLPHGRCVGVTVPTLEEATNEGDLLVGLLSEEREHLASLPAARRPSWWAGRMALRAALEHLGVPHTPLLPDERGAPRVPLGARGSISHKTTLAVALAGRAEDPDDFELGVDLEDLARPPRQNIGRRVLTRNEQMTVAALPEPERARALLLRFSLKEALYKAVSPYVRRHVSFQEVEVEPTPEGRALYTLGFACAVGPLTAEGRWTVVGPDALVTSARVSRRASLR